MFFFVSLLQRVMTLAALPVVQSVQDGVRTTKDENVSSLDGLDGATVVDYN
jgi:hypothetical protein